MMSRSAWVLALIAARTAAAVKDQPGSKGMDEDGDNSRRLPPPDPPLPGQPGYVRPPTPPQHPEPWMQPVGAQPAESHQPASKPPAKPPPGLRPRTSGREAAAAASGAVVAERQAQLLASGPAVRPKAALTPSSSFSPSGEAALASSSSSSSSLSWCEFSPTPLQALVATARRGSKRPKSAQGSPSPKAAAPTPASSTPAVPPLLLGASWAILEKPSWALFRPRSREC